jgi:hypothetical protein
MSKLVWSTLLVVGLTASSISSAQTSVSSPGVNCIQPQAVGNGMADDTAALQAALNSAGVGKRAACIQPGLYKYTSYLVVPSNVSVYGLSGNLNRAVELLPTNRARLRLDGATQSPGGFFIRSKISNLTFRLSSVQASAIYINQAYHLTLDHVAVYAAKFSTVAALRVNSINTLVCNFCVLCRNQSAPSGKGMLIGDGGPAVVQMNSPNIEGLDVGMTVNGMT